MKLSRLLCGFLFVVTLLAPVHAAAPAKTPEEILTSLGLSLSISNTPVANYVPAVRTGNLIFLSGHIPRDAEGNVITGKVGRDADEATAKNAAKAATLVLLSSLKKELGELSKVKRIVRVTGFVNAVDDFKGHSQVLNGCSDLLGAVFGSRGHHVRSAIGVASLPLDAVVEIEMIVEVQ